MLAFWSSSLSFSLVVKDDKEIIDRRFTKLRSLFPSSRSSLSPVNSFSFSSSPEEEELEDLGNDIWETMMPLVPLDTVDGGDEEGEEREVVSES